MLVVYLNMEYVLTPLLERVGPVPPEQVVLPVP
jgi:hypothetical protein